MSFSVTVDQPPSGPRLDAIAPPHPHLHTGSRPPTAEVSSLDPVAPALPPPPPSTLAQPSMPAAPTGPEQPPLPALTDHHHYGASDGEKPRKHHPHRGHHNGETALMTIYPALEAPVSGYGPLLPASMLSLIVGLVCSTSVVFGVTLGGWSSSIGVTQFFLQAACWVTAGIIGLVMAESSTVTLDFPRRELTVRRYRALLAMCCAVGRTTVPFSSFVAVELRPACCGGAPWWAAQEVFLVADHPLEGRREVAVVAKVSADEAEEELKRWKDFLTHVAVQSVASL